MYFYYIIHCTLMLNKIHTYIYVYLGILKYEFDSYCAASEKRHSKNVIKNKQKLILVD